MGLTPDCPPKWGYVDPDIIPPKPKFSCMSKHTTVRKGFGRFMLEWEPVTFEEKLSPYPPLPNAAYDFLSRNLSTTPPSTPSLDGAALVKEYILIQNAEDKRLIREGSTSLGELIAEKIDWSLKLYNGGELGISGTPSVCIAPWRRDLVTAIDNAKEVGQEPFEMCNKYQKRHIPWGRQWHYKIEIHALACSRSGSRQKILTNHGTPLSTTSTKAVRFEERDQGRVLNQDRRVWDKEFHEPTEEWKAIGRRGGWWKCRTGNCDGEANVPMVESNCRLCHRAKTEEEAAEARILNDATEKIRIQLWIEQCMKSQMEKDKAVVQAQMRHSLE